MPLVRSMSAAYLAAPKSPREMPDGTPEAKSPALESVERESQTGPLSLPSRSRPRT